MAINMSDWSKKKKKWQHRKGVVEREEWTTVSFSGKDRSLRGVNKSQSALSHDKQHYVKNQELKFWSEVQYM